MGGHPLFRVARTGREGPVDLARGKRLDREAVAGTSGCVCADGPNGASHRAPAKRRSAFSPAKPNIAAEFVIFAAPTFLAPYLVEGMAPLHDFEYSPWLTANLTLERLPENYGADVTWDNVVMDSPTLGYVDAMHQTLRSHVERTVWTFYWALAEGTPSENRRLLLEKDWGYWKEAILHDLERVHPDIRQCVSRIDIMRFGHAMARPKSGRDFFPRAPQACEPRWPAAICEF